MTEDEAKTKWCPMARYIIDEGNQGTYAAGNRPIGAPFGVGSNCIASDCMMWRWNNFVGKARDLEIGIDVDVVTDKKSTIDGCCGLAK